ncbi:O-methyltransferase [Micromonospora rifamycinica]|uniref:Predicted O-methyltransferase YrrM n=1 Tax=Micromonospora rifamycinica TaxID=291594 RepID=A0A120F9J3_9ACTN|nr:class I SAM-dependent methyltransferase [Micromonospora rifamycinica]KWV33471.1 methyltransferase [Micromonospora rifamycinica]SCG74912.1 Predicted O-methyltransferase YrrM [Micromonospora rifamycinica]
MTTTLYDPAVRDLITRLFTEAERDDERSPCRTAPTTTSQERADLLEDVYMPISARGGDLLYALVRAARPQTVVEFGTSYGISTLYLAAAVRDNGVGHVTTTELSATKVKAARATIEAAGLSDLVTVLEGDALTTLGTVGGPIGLALLDGWKELCLPVLRRIEDRLAPGALVVGDDSTFDSMSDYVAYVRDPDNGYVSVDFPVEDGMELSCWTGR